MADVGGDEVGRAALPDRGQEQVAVRDVAGAGHAGVRQSEREMEVRSVHGELLVDAAGIAAGAGVPRGGRGEQGPFEADRSLGRVHRRDVVQGLDQDHRPGERSQHHRAGLQRRAAGGCAGPVETGRGAAVVEDGTQQRGVGVGVGAVQAARQDGEGRPARFGGCLVGGGVDAVRERGGDGVTGLGEGGGEVVRAGDGLLGGDPVAGHGDGARGEPRKSLAAADPQAQRARGPQIGEGGGPLVVRGDDERAGQLCLGEFLARPVGGEEPAAIALDAPLPHLGRGVLGEVAGELAGGEVSGERGACGSVGQGVCGHGGWPFGQGAAPAGEPAPRRGGEGERGSAPTGRGVPSVAGGGACGLGPVGGPLLLPPRGWAARSPGGRGRSGGLRRRGRGDRAGGDRAGQAGFRVGDAPAQADAEVVELSLTLSGILVSAESSAQGSPGLRARDLALVEVVLEGSRPAGCGGFLSR